MAKPRNQGAAESAAAPVGPTVTQDQVTSPSSAAAAETSAPATGATEPAKQDAQQPTPPAVAGGAVEHKAPISLAQATGPGEPTVTMVIPPQKHGGPVRVRKADHSVVLIPTGIREVPASLVDHWHLKACGAKPYTK